MTQNLEGRSQDVANNFLGSEFWQPGVHISGRVLRKFESANGQCYALELDERVGINGEDTRDVALGNLTGLRMAVQPPELRIWMSEITPPWNALTCNPRPRGIPASTSK
jgi:hypothetical protein